MIRAQRSVWFGLAALAVACVVPSPAATAAKRAKRTAGAIHVVYLIGGKREVVKFNMSRRWRQNFEKRLSALKKERRIPESKKLVPEMVLFGGSGLKSLSSAISDAIAMTPGVTRVIAKDTMDSSIRTGHRWRSTRYMDWMDPAQAASVLRAVGVALNTKEELQLELFHRWSYGGGQRAMNAIAEQLGFSLGARRVVLTGNVLPIVDQKELNPDVLATWTVAVPARPCCSWPLAKDNNWSRPNTSTTGRIP